MCSIRFLRSWLSCPLLLFVCAAASPAEERFITVSGDRLLDGTEEFRFISFNIPNLHNVEDSFSFTRTNPWRWPDEFEIADALESVRQMGGNVVRIYVISVRREGSDAGDHCHVLGPGQFNEEAFDALDRVLHVARQLGIRVIIPFVDKWHWWGGIEQYAGFRGKPAEAFWTDRQIIDDFKRTISYVVGRENQLNGIQYKDDPTILGWETGNEIDATGAWTSEIAAHIKQLDSRHLVIDGNSLQGIQATSLADPNIDVVTTHHYPAEGVDMLAEIRRARADSEGRKPYFVGEFGFVPFPEFTQILNAVVEEGVSGALVWSLRFHCREGGFYWHSEPAGGGLFKAYHWPGFAVGAAYAERQTLDLIRQHAFQIRGLQEPARQPPAAPRLLPIPDSGHISWQGAAGANRYTVERAEMPGGPWVTVAADISDAKVQYRPLFCDTEAGIGRTYYYRVRAENEAGMSPPSNIAGPVENTGRYVIDDLVDFSRLASRKGEVKIVANQARAAQEDTHRLIGTPGASITYRMSGLIRAWQVDAFVKDGPAETLKFAGSADGTQFSTWNARRIDYAPEQGDYGYAIPVRFRGNPAGKSWRWLRIEFPGETANGAARSHPPGELVTQISRIEIEYVDGEDAEVSRSLERRARVEGLLVGSLIGDAAGGPIEFKRPEEVARLMPGCRQWSVDRQVIHDDLRDWSRSFRLLSYHQLRPEPAPYGPWSAAAPEGTVTDDTRHKFLLLAALRRAREDSTMPLDARQLAAAYLSYAQSPAIVARPQYAELCEEGFREFVLAARWVLGERDPAVARPPDRLWGGVPTCCGQMTLPPLAALFPQAPDSAYRAAYQLAFFDNGPAKDINSALVAGLVAALDTPGELVRQSPDEAWASIVATMKGVDPYRYAEVPFVQRPVVRWLDFAHEAVQRAQGSPQRLFQILEEEGQVQYFWESHFILALVFATIEFCDYEPLAAMQLILDFGHDTDSGAQLLGAFVGALHGRDIFPAPMRERVAQRLAADYDESLAAAVDLLVELGDPVGP